MQRCYIVTGASRGLGAAVCEQLVELGHKVLATARSQSDLETLWKDNSNVVVYPCDLSVPDAPKKIVKRALDEFGRLDGLVNNAGMIAPISPLKDTDQQEWAKAIYVNLTAPSLLMAEALGALTESGGAVVNISTGAAVKVVEGWSAYCASKAGFLHLTQVAAQENPKVRFYSLRPGVIDTEMQREIRDSKGMTETDLAKFQGLKAEGQLEPPEVPARSAAWLLVEGPKERSGEFIQYTDEEVKSGAERLFSTVRAH